MNSRNENQSIFALNGIGFLKDWEEAYDRWVEIKEKTPGISLLPEFMVEEAGIPVCLHI